MKTADQRSFDLHKEVGERKKEQNCLQEQISVYGADHLNKERGASGAIFL